MCFVKTQITKTDRFIYQYTITYTSSEIKDKKAQSSDISDKSLQEKKRCIKMALLDEEDYKELMEELRDNEGVKE